MPTRQPASFNPTFSHIAGVRAARSRARAATREKALFIIGRWSRRHSDIIHADGGSRDLRNHLLAQRTPDTFWEIDWLYRGIEAG